MKRTNVLKTYKLFINGQFPRSESGHYFQVKDPETKKILANLARASRKDLRDAVKAARGAFPSWSGKTAYNRGQILYRIAEMLEARRTEFAEAIIASTGAKRSQADDEVSVSIDRMIWYAGWADKFSQVFSSVNPVALPYFNFTMPEAMGVVGIVAADELSLLPLVSQLAPAIVSGNTSLVLASDSFPLPAILFAEVLATSDVPPGVINILTGPRKELLPHLAKHMDVNAVHYVGQNSETRKLLQTEGAANVKRIIASEKPNGDGWFSEKAQSPYLIEAFVEMKTTWHPVGT
ncbi:MAG: aldehyde dehydrogenase family protein [Deltaproteobacteria bacterium]|nr:aldehyde dehydrogenase family protein [Deltaproteobacteria bacterium]